MKFCKLMKDYVWGYGSVICGGYFIYIVCAIGAEDFRIEFLNKYSAMYNDIKVNDNKHSLLFQPNAFFCPKGCSSQL